MNAGTAMLSGIGIGTGLMFFLDPNRGRRRREVVRDSVARAADASGNAIGSVTGWRRRRNEWSPAWRAAVGALGGSLAAYGFSRHNPWWSAAGAVGATLLARGITNREIRRGFGLIRRAA